MTTESSQYDWYGGKPETSIVSADIPDQRKLPVLYPADNNGRDLATGCRVNGDHIDEGGHLQCKYGKKSSFGNGCMYYKFNCMCDKLIGSDGKELN